MDRLRAEGTTFIDKSDVALYLEVSDGLTVLTLNCSLQYFYTTAIHDTKPLVLSFPLSALRLCPGRAGCSSALVMGRVSFPEVLVDGCLAGGCWGILFFFSVLLYSLRQAHHKNRNR